jgi:uncharacterized damage-inducible protein DinB
MSNLKDTGLEALAFSRRVLLRLLDGFDESNILVRCGEGASHTMHLVGHIGTTDDFFLTTLSGHASGLPEGYAALFGTGAVPKDDASAYPSFETMTDVLEDRRAALVAWFKSQDEDELLTALPGQLAGFAKNRAVLMSTLAFHEGFHTGQVSAIRRKLGMERALG